MRIAWVCCLILPFIHEASAQSLIDKTPAVTFGTTVVIPAGLRGEIYFLHKGSTVLPDFDRLRPVGVIWTNLLNIPPRHWRAGFPGVTKRNEWFGIDYKGRFWIDKPGRYKFALLSDDGSRLFIDGQLVIDNDCQHPPDVRAAAVILNGGVHQIRVGYFQGPRDCIALILAVADPGGEWHIFNTDEYKPPSNPDDWTYTSAGQLTIFTDFEPALEVDKLLRNLGKDSGAPMRDRSASGCMIPDPVHYCGK